MSSDESSGTDNRQRTVAELLAAHGKDQNGSAPRRRRRRAEDATEETAPQAIIDRVRSDSGTFRPVDPNAVHAPPSHSAERGSGYRAPVAPPEQQPTPHEPTRQQPAVGQQPAPPQPPAPTQQQPAVTQQQAAATQQRPPVQAPSWPAGGPGRQPAPSGAQPPPVRREQQNQPVRQPPAASRPGALGARLGAPAADPHTEQFPAVEHESPAGRAPRSGEPPAGLAPANGRRPEAAAEQTQYGAAVELDEDDEPQEQDAHEREVHSGAAQRASLANRLAGLRRPSKRQDTSDGFDAFGTRTAAPVEPDDDYAEDDEDADYYDDGYQEDGYREDYADEDYDDEDYDDDHQDDDHDDQHSGYDEDDEPAGQAHGTPGSAREWLTLAGLVAASVVGGAAVWLAFDWFWGVLPAGALAGALVVIAAMVWIVRRFRRAEDMQTMVLSVLAGLVMTVSPAALLLVGR